MKTAWPMLGSWATNTQGFIVFSLYLFILCQIFHYKDFFKQQKVIFIFEKVGKHSHRNDPNN